MDTTGCLRAVVVARSAVVAMAQSLESGSATVV